MTRAINIPVTHDTRVRMHREAHHACQNWQNGNFECVYKWLGKSQLRTLALYWCLRDQVNIQEAELFMRRCAEKRGL